VVPAPGCAHTIASPVRHPHRDSSTALGPSWFVYTLRALAGCLRGVATSSPARALASLQRELDGHDTGVRSGCLGQARLPGAAPHGRMPRANTISAGLFTVPGSTLALCVRAAVHCFFRLLCMRRSLLSQAPGSRGCAGSGIQATFQSRAALCGVNWERNACNVTLHLASGTERVCALSRSEQKRQLVNMLQLSHTTDLQPRLDALQKHPAKQTHNMK